MVARVSTPEDSLVLESASDNTSDYSPEDFTEETEEDGAAQGMGDEEGDDESIGDHREGDPADDVEGHAERVEPEGSEYREGDE